MRRTDKRVFRHKLRTGETAQIRQFVNSRGQTVIEVIITIVSDVDRRTKAADNTP